MQNIIVTLPSLSDNTLSQSCRSRHFPFGNVKHFSTVKMWLFSRGQRWSITPRQTVTVSLHTTVQHHSELRTSEEMGWEVWEKKLPASVHTQAQPQDWMHQWAQCWQPRQIAFTFKATDPFSLTLNIVSRCPNIQKWIHIHTVVLILTNGQNKTVNRHISPNSFLEFNSHAMKSAQVKKYVKELFRNCGWNVTFIQILN